MKKGRKTQTHCKEPDWNFLIQCGLPLVLESVTKRRGASDARSMRVRFLKELKNACLYLIDEKDRAGMGRMRDGVKALLCSLKTHYPTTFRLFEAQIGAPINKIFELENISGRDIKLRNISLATLSKRKIL